MTDDNVNIVCHETIAYLRALKSRPKRVQNFPVSRPCAKCGEEHWRLRTSGNPAAYCKACHAENMREWRKTHGLNEEQRRKDNCRSYSAVLLRRGKIERGPCLVCGSDDAQMHHPDYSNPRLVEWLCRDCHLGLHLIEATSEDAA